MSFGIKIINNPFFRYIDYRLENLFFVLAVIYYYLMFLLSKEV
ncbi:hypothetical Protein psc1_06600 [Candidatus Phytoplasma solani]